METYVFAPILLLEVRVYSEIRVIPVTVSEKTSRMRLITLILIGLSSTALAHTPDGDTLVSLTHSLTSPHHLTLALIALLACVILFRRRAAGRVKSKRNR